MEAAHRERPDTRLELYLVAGLLLAACAGAGWLVARIAGAAGAPRPLEFAGLLFLLVLAAYLCLMAYELRTVCYLLEEQELRVAQGRRAVTIDLSRPIRLHRWLNRWNGEAAPRDLGGVAVEWYPPLALVRTGTWVVLGQDASGQRRALALRPSPRLLALLREWALPTWGEEHDETPGF
ncbi:hypothetical protein J2Z79_000479 [Symbiobacterium terraclitae]|uniref:Bacterial Pleckstrin homology domain-containing protein n=1 Tax=Symbiobacterium terraclitae TaxID=557451 RepID=A0ABS4JNK3_9FIRM|nr:hypothetical protein [Symbiobacterium terraclitae]MBP2017105.1 hypothetical protein [Symbiobacterium terraclitae]